MQDNNANDSGLEYFQTVGSFEAADKRCGLVHSLASQQEDDCQGGFDSIVESDYKKITETQSEVYCHMFATPIEEFFQGDDGEEAH